MPFIKSTNNKMEIILASSNEGKFKEFSALTKKTNIRLGSLPKNLINLPDETGLTFEENALIKANHVFKQVNSPVLADDSGLEVDCLDGAPGIMSARYSKKATDEGNIKKILSDMKGVKGWKRRARFKCCLMLKLNRSLEPIRAEGFLEGLIAEVPKGEGGFGYDPIFLLPALGLSLAEITKEKKNEISHRSKAFILLLKKLSLINY